jgi:hypothetical protein
MDVPAAAAPPVAGRITVALIPKAAADLERLRERSGLSTTDLVNRAVSAYEFLDELMRSGDQLLIRRDGETRLVTFL